MKHLIIDGYNVIRQTAPYFALAERGDWDYARDALVGDVASFVGPEFHVTVVFDGTSNPQSIGEPARQYGVTVIFSPNGKTADTVIESLARVGRERGDHIEVVTSDAQTQWTVMGQTVTRRSSREFAEELSVGYEEYQREKKGPPSRSVLEDRISPDARAMLRRIRDGHSK